VGQLNFKYIKEAMTEVADCVDLDEILDPYARMRGDYYIVEIVMAEYCKLDESRADFIALEFVVCERCGNISSKEKVKFKGKKLFCNISLHPKKIWQLKNLSNAIGAEGKVTYKELLKMMFRKKVKARVIGHYDMELDTYFHLIDKFQTEK
jgi:hypothetical protein